MSLAGKRRAGTCSASAGRSHPVVVAVGRSHPVVVVVVGRSHPVVVVGAVVAVGRRLSSWPLS